MTKYEYTVQGVDYEVEILEVEGTLAKVTVNGTPFEVELKQPISVGKQIHAHQPAAKPAAAKVVGEAPKQEAPKQEVHAGDGEKVCSPLPGTITSIPVKVGDAVAVGDTVVVLEAMKMQNNIEAENAGTITSILVKEGESVMEGAVLVTIA